ncbi:MAG: serine/threonine protein phosphatase [Deltaproteobacteria bacterium]|nr:serine/threonine protein phosphatase [Deltaproteobacteria bacterium]
MKKIFAIGDVHGCIAKLQDLVSALPFDTEQDTLLFLGDYIDRGPDSKGVIDYLLDLRRKIGNVVFLSGNHEQMFLNYYRRNEGKQLFLMNGGESTIISYGRAGLKDGRKMNVPESHLEFFDSLRTSYETDRYIFVHAGLKPGIPWEMQTPEDMLWIRHEFIGSTADFGKTVVFGHTSLDEPLVGKNKIGIDTGAVYGGKLTCVELPSLAIYQV